MKLLQHLSFLGLAIITLVLTSCTMEKRVYMSGYHIEWNKSRNSIDQKENLKNNLTTEQIQILKEDESTMENSTLENSAGSIDEDNNISASIERNSIFIPSHKPISLHSNTIRIKNEFNSETKKEHKKGIEKFILKNTQQNSAVDDRGVSGMAIAGLACSVFGLLLFFLTGWPFLLGTLGVIFSAIGMSKTGRDKKIGKGFAIAGLAVGILDILLFWILVVILAALVSAII